jgi:hypothetical protein
MLNNLTNFFNLIAGKRVKTTANPDDLITLGVRDPRTPGIYQPAAIKVSDLVSTSGVTSVTGTAPVVSSGGSTPAISMPAANFLVSGYLTSTNFNTFFNKQAALVSGTNIKTINSTSILGSGNLTISGTGGIHIPVEPVATRVYDLRIVGSSLTTSVTIPDGMRLLPFLPNNNLTPSQLSVNVTTGSVGSFIKILVFSDLAGAPSSKLSESPDLDCSTTGIKTVFVGGLQFNAGETYWIGIITNLSGPILTGYSTSNVIPISSSLSAPYSPNWLLASNSYGFNSVPTLVLATDFFPVSANAPVVFITA